jgi:hypothetical protein
VVADRTRAAVDRWLHARPRDWLARIATVAPDPWRGYAGALVAPLGHATVVVDHFRIRKLLLTAAEQLTSQGRVRLRAGLAVGDPTGEVAAALAGQGCCAPVYAASDLAHARAALERLCRWADGVEVAELSRLARAVRAWEAEILAWHATNGCSNGPTGAVNLLIKKVKRVGQLSMRSSPDPVCPLQRRGDRRDAPRWDLHRNLQAPVGPWALTGYRDVDRDDRRACGYLERRVRRADPVSHPDAEVRELAQPIRQAHEKGAHGMSWKDEIRSLKLPGATVPCRVAAPAGSVAGGSPESESMTTEGDPWDVEIEGACRQASLQGSRQAPVIPASVRTLSVARSG